MSIIGSVLGEPASSLTKLLWEGPAPHPMGESVRWNICTHVAVRVDYLAGIALGEPRPLQDTDARDGMRSIITGGRIDSGLGRWMTPATIAAVGREEPVWDVIGKPDVRAFALFQQAEEMARGKPVPREVIAEIIQEFVERVYRRANRRS